MKGFTDGEMERCAESGDGYRFGDLVIYPLTVRDYGAFYACMPSLTLRMSMIPAAYAVRPFAEAIFAMAMSPELREAESELSSCFARFVHLLALSARVPVETFQYHVDANDHTKLKAIVVKQETDEGEDLIRLETGQLGQIRRIIAELNGKELPDEADNAELVEAEADIRNKGITDMNVDISDLKASVAAYYHVRLREINDWTIYEFEKARSAIERMTRCVICGIGEASGMAKYEKGNPFPSLFFDRIVSSPALISASEFQRRTNGSVEMSSGFPSELPMNIN